jgi:hypothetical protein
VAGLVAVKNDFQVVTDAKNALRLARANLKAKAAANRAFVKNATSALIQAYGTDSADLAACGITPKKTPAKRTSVENAVAAAKAAETRKLRGTKGSRQKAAIVYQGQPAVVMVGADGKPLVNAPANEAPAPASANEATPVAPAPVTPASGGSH